MAIARDVITAYLTGDYRYRNIKELEADIEPCFVVPEQIQETQDARVKRLAGELNRYLKSEPRKPVDVNKCIYLDLSNFVTTDFEGSENVYVIVDAIFKKTGVLEFVVYKPTAPDIGTTSRSKRSVFNEIPLYLLLRAARQYVDTLLAEGESINLIASYYYLKKQKDTSLSALNDSYFGDSEPVRSLTETYKKSKAGETYFETDLDKTFKDLIDKWATGYEKCDMDEEKDCSKCPSYAVCYYKPAPDHYIDPEETGTKKRADHKHNDEQLAIINACDGVIQVNAGAGAGKTETAIKARTKHIVEDMLAAFIAEREELLKEIETMLATVESGASANELTTLLERYESLEEKLKGIEFITMDSRY